MNEGLGSNNGILLRGCTQVDECSTTPTDASAVEWRPALVHEPTLRRADRREDGQPAQSCEPKPWRGAVRTPQAKAQAGCAFAVANFRS